MTRPNAGPASTDGIDPDFAEPSTRRVTLGSPPVASPPGEPYFSQPSFAEEVDPADPVFSVIRDRISRLWDEGASAADIQGVLVEVHNRQD